MFIQPKTLWHQWQIIKKCPQNRCLGQQTAGTDGLAWKEHCFVKIVSTLTAYSGVISTEVLLYTSHSDIKSFLYHLPKKSNLRLAHITRVETHTLCSNNWVLRLSITQFLLQIWATFSELGIPPKQRNSWESRSTFTGTS